MKVLEIFAGSRSIGKSAEFLGFDVFSIDINDFSKIDYVVDVLNIDLDQIPFIPDIIWASPPCTSFSVASMAKHWTKDNKPKTESAKNGLALVEKTIDIIQYYQALNSDLIWYIENPRGKLRKLIKTHEGKRRTVTFCQYNDKRMKPTDIWTNNLQWLPVPMCKNNDSCHESAPRGSQTGTQGLKNNYERSKIPAALCVDVLLSAYKSIRSWKNITIDLF